MSARRRVRRGAVAHRRLDLAEAAVLTEAARPRGPERCDRLADALELRARALRGLTESRYVEPDRFGHVARAIELAARADDERAAALRRALARPRTGVSYLNEAADTVTGEPHGHSSEVRDAYADQQYAKIMERARIEGAV